MRIESLLIIVLGVAAIAAPAFAQSTDDLNVWNVYCNGDSSECAISKEATGVLMFPQFSGGRCCTES